MTNHGDVQALHLQRQGLEDFHRRHSGTGAKRQIVINDVADGGRVHALDILEGVHGFLQRFHRDVLRQRALDDDPVHAGIVV